MRQVIVAVSVFCWLAGLAGRADGQTVGFAAGYPVWSPAPNRSVDTKMEWTTAAGQTVTKTEITIYKVTFPGGSRAESLIGFAVQNNPPTAIPANGTFSYLNNIGMAGTYCVKIRMIYSNGVQSFQPSTVARKAKAESATRRV
ncbi:MAG: hypothetical protein K2W96_12140 [Gemmataceae bacterium]|nr:hypothetical protein [Gemmataceae bacterium]